MMANSTFIGVPHKVDDTIALKRFLDTLIQQLDVAFGNRGEGEFSVLITNATTLQELKDDINTLGSVFVAKDSSNLDKELVYKTQPSHTGLGLVTKDYADGLISKQSSPTLINSGSSGEIKAIADKLDNLIGLLQSAKILI